MTKSMESKILVALDYIKNRVFNPDTRLVYDHCHAKNMSHFPTPEEVEAVFPNPDGYSVGMEDGMINGGTMVDGVLLKYELFGDEKDLCFARELVTGMLDCAACAKSEGFVPRSVSAVDGKSHYPDSSIDQYTMFVFGLMRFIETGKATDYEKERIKNAIVSVAKRAEKNPAPENDFDLLREDGGKTLAGKIWGKNRGNHEVLRLPMIFAAAYKLSGDRHWWEKYEEFIDEGIERSLPMTDYWHLYTLQQMQASIYVCKVCDENEERVKKLSDICDTVANYAVSKCGYVLSQIRSLSNFNAPYKPFRECEKDLISRKRFADVGFPEAFHPAREDAHEFFTLQDAANIAVVVGFSKNVKANDAVMEVFLEGFDKIDFEKHERCVPVHFIDGYYRAFAKR